MGAITQRLDTISIAATPEECAALATRFELADINGLSATLEYRRLPGNQRIQIEGRVEGQCTQYCVATWQEVPAKVKEQFTTEFTQTVWEESQTDLEQPEVITDDVIDLGEMVAQYFYLALDPYPRAESHVPEPKPPKRPRKSPVASSKEAKPAKAAVKSTAAKKPAVAKAAIRPANDHMTADPAPVEKNTQATQTSKGLFMQHLQRLAAQK